MSLRGKKVRPVKISHPALKRGSGLTGEDLDTIKFVVGQFVSAFGYKYLDDFVSEALLALTVGKDLQPDHPNWTGYLTRKIDGYITDYLRREHRYKRRYGAELQNEKLARPTKKLDLQIEDENDALLVDLLSKGYKFEEISKLLNVSVVTLYQRRARLRDRLNGKFLV